MDLRFDISLAARYHSHSQQIRVISEDWLGKNVYCPKCGHTVLTKYINNKPVADFYCEQCHEDYELKSRENTVASIVPDGAYDKMIERIQSLNNPNFFFLSYVNYEVRDLFFVPNYFFTPSVIIKRKPLGPNAKRAGWVGCNIRVDDIPDSGKIYLVRGGLDIDKTKVIEHFKRSSLFKTDNIEKRGWVFDVLKCVERIPTDNFSLAQVYTFEAELKAKHPDNNFVLEKIRQQLQVLRDKGVIEFTTRGNYRKIK